MRKTHSKRRIPLLDLKVSAAARREVAATLASGWLTTGPRAAALEKAVAKRLGVRYAAAVSSATAGLQLVLAALGMGPTRDVITTPFTFVATIEAILAVGARPILADINPDTLNMDADEVARKVSGRSAVVLPVDIAGWPVDYKAINEVCGKHNLALVSDSAHAFGSLVGRRSPAQLADASVYSFYSTKNLTCGEGGLVASRHKILIDRVRLLARHGLTSDAHQRQQSGTWYYDAPALGIKANLSDIHAAVGLGQLHTFDSDQKRRVALVERYRENLGDLSEYLELPRPPRGTTHAWHLLIGKLHLSRLRLDRNQFIRAMGAKDVECGVHYRPLFELSYYRDALGLSPQHFPNTAYVAPRVVTLPLYPTLRPADVDYVCECIRQTLLKYAR